MRKLARASLVVAVLGMALVLAGPFAAQGAPADDSTAALQAQLDQLSPGATLTLERRTYPHSGIIRIQVPGVRIEGNGATLQATNDQTSAVQINAPGVSLANLNLTAPLAGPRLSGLGQHKLLIDANDVTVTNVAITGSAAAGVYVTGANNFQLNGVTVRDTRADGIHITGGSTNGRVNRPTTGGTGDDGVAVVSYTADPAPCQNIVIDSPVINGTNWGRGVAVVGGNNVTVRNPQVSSTSAAGIYVASEGGPNFYTKSVDGVDISGGAVTNANVDSGIIQGAILVFAGNPGQDVSDVSVSNVVISGTAPSAQRNVGILSDGGGVRNITFRGIQLQGTSLPPLWANVPHGSYSTSGFTLDGRAIDNP